MHRMMPLPSADDVQREAGGATALDRASTSRQSSEIGELLGRGPLQAEVAKPPGAGINRW